MSHKPECAKILSAYEPVYMITSERMTCIQTCVRFQRFDLFKYFLQFESLVSLKDIYDLQILFVHWYLWRYRPAYAETG